MNKFIAVSLLLASAGWLHSEVVLHYDFEEGTNGTSISSVTDVTGNGLDGTSASADVIPVYAVTTPYGSAFSGDYRGDFNYIRRVDDPALHLQQFTIELSFRAASPYTVYGNAPSTMLTKRIQQEGVRISNYALAYNSNNDSISGTLSWGPENGLVLASTAGSALKDTWHHAALTLQRDINGEVDRLSLYLDGTLVDSVEQAFPPIVYSDLPLDIGSGNFGSAGPTDPFRRNFDGWIDNVRISDVALPPSELLSSQAGCSDGPTINLTPIGDATLRIEFCGILQWSETLEEWQTLDPQPVSPWVLTIPQGQPGRFFRAAE